MNNTFGQAISVTLFGESHGPAIGAVVDGLAPGLPVEPETIRQALARRRPASNAETPRVERDAFEIVSGVFEGKTTGTPLCLIIPNENTRSGDYTYGVARPSHADYAAFCKYHGFEDYRGGGHFSGRITAALVAVGGLLLPALQKAGIRVGSHILQCADVWDRPFETYKNDLNALYTADFPVLTPEAGEEMQKAILAAKEENDSVGGMIQTAVCGLPAGLGEPWFDSLEGMLSHGLFSIGGIKGVSFGAGFELAAMRGSQANDPMRMEQGQVNFVTNHNGGINGGITNGAPVVFQCAVKPTPSIARSQQTVDFCRRQNADLTVEGRHDPAIVRRICPVIDSITAIAVADLLTRRFGTDALQKGDSLWNTD